MPITLMPAPAPLTTSAIALPERIGLSGDPYDLQRARQAGLSEAGLVELSWEELETAVAAQPGYVWIGCWQLMRRTLVANACRDLDGTCLFSA